MQCTDKNTTVVKSMVHVFDAHYSLLYPGNSLICFPTMLMIYLESMPIGVHKEIGPFVGWIYA